LSTGTEEHAIYHEKENKMKSAGLLANWAPILTAALALVFVAAPTASASSGTMVVSTTTTLTEDHYGNIQITASNVTLDCGGHVVFGPGVPGFAGGIQVEVGLNAVTVKRCGVTGFDVNGIYQAPGATDCRYEANVPYRNGNHGMHLESGTGYVVVDNIARSNGAIGIVLTGSTQSWIVHNTAQENDNWAGIALLDGSHDNHVVNNTSVKNRDGILLLDSTNNQVELNRASLNSTQGMNVIRSANNDVASNTLNQNLIGIELAQSGSNTVRSNTLNRNKTEGVKVFMSDGNTITRNTANENNEIGFLVWFGSSFNTLTRNVGHQNLQLDALDDGTGSGNVWSDNQFGTTSGF
jgi:parallel beta-helix repeat protein